jgi:hypothetical protein
MATDYQVLEATGGTTWTLTEGKGFERFFVAARGVTTQAYFTVALRTEYATENLAASVRVNGTEISKVAPRPRQPGESMIRAVHVIFPCLDDQLFIPPPDYFPNTFEIIAAPGAGIDSIVHIRQVIFHYWF